MYKNMDVAVNLFNHTKGSVGIVIDSDLDGACSAAIAYMLCIENGLEDIRIYSHAGKEHGLSDLTGQITIDELDLLIVPDAGSNDIYQCEELMCMGIDVIILDHHIIEKSNKYATVVNPYNSAIIRPMPDDQMESIEHKYWGVGGDVTYTCNADISGTGVVEKFACALGSKQSFKDLVAVSLISDICNLRSLENRKYVYDGLTNPTNPFIKYCLEHCCNRGVNPEGVAFGIAPLANALARSDDQSTKRLFFDALIGKIEPEAAVKAMKAVKSKQDYQVKKVVDKLSDGLDTSHKVIIGFGEPENKSYLGLVANKFCGKYNKPTFLLRELNSTTWSGSMRSPIDLLEIINKSGLAKCQGHGAAAGITVKKSNLKRFARFLDGLDLDVEPDIEVAAQIAPNNITHNLANLCVENNILWGQGVPKPLFHLTLSSPQIYIYRNRSTTVKLIQDDVEFIKFFVSNEEASQFESAQGKSIEVVVSLGLNEYNGQIKPQAIIELYEIIDKPNDNEIDWEVIFH
jgi:single-stranded-DNA-specific exonuclease|nr:MAG TPA: single-stranded-DNA-specific exonuclease RecJ [Caudoviricetes sp.]